MAAIKISALPAVTGVQDTDELVLARSGTTNKIEASDLLSNALVFAPHPAPPAYADSDVIVATDGPNLAIGSALSSIVVPGAHGNTALGYGARSGLPTTGNLGQMTTGFDNTALGAGVLVSVTTGHGNTGIGADALSAVTTGNNNMMIGPQAGEHITTGSFNVGIGGGTLQAVVTSSDNVAIGSNTLVNFLGARVVAIGTGALASLIGTAGVTPESVAIGWGAAENVIGGGNTAIGYATLRGGTVGATNITNSVAIGDQALQLVTTGGGNTAIGYNALGALTTGTGCVAIGNQAGVGLTTGSNNTFIGLNAGRAVTAHVGCTVIGYQAGYTSSFSQHYMTLIGHGVYGQAPGCVAIGVDSAGNPAGSNDTDKFVLGTVNHKLFIPGLPTTNPAVAGQLWNNGGVVTVSAG